MALRATRRSRTTARHKAPLSRKILKRKVRQVASGNHAPRRLTINLLGAFDVSDGESPLQFRSDKIRALLAYLVVESGQSHQREQLAHLLWSELPSESAATNLRNSLSRLRATLAAIPKSSELLAVTPFSVQYKHRPDCYLDVVQFSQLAEDCRTHRHRQMSTCRQCFERLRQIADLYRGEFLAGFKVDDAPEFDDWLSARRETFDRHAGQAFEYLAMHHERLDDHDAAISYAHRHLQFMPWSESAHQTLMRAYALTGQRNLALAQFEKCTRALSDELGVTPSDQTAALYELVRDGMLRAGMDDGDGQWARGVQPVAATPFVGRENELMAIYTALSNPGCRLLTLYGFGGIGKTRLASQAAWELRASFEDGSCFVPLAPVVRGAALIPAISEALGLPISREEEIERQLLEYLRDRELLLVLDNVEHLLFGVTEVIIKLLRSATRLAIMVTSRERLNVYGEWAIEVAGLPVPDETSTWDVLEEGAASRILLQTVRRSRPILEPTEENLKAVIAVCRLVDGMPLALELAGGWAQMYSLKAIRDQLAEQIDFLESLAVDTPDRHRSLRLIFESSWDKLPDHEKTVLQALSIFPAAFAHEAAQSISGVTATELIGLNSKSLLNRYDDGWYSFHPLLRRFLLDKAHASMLETIAREKFAAYYASFLSRHADSLRGGDQRQALTDIRLNLDNIRAAWAWCVQQGRLDLIAEALDGLYRFYDMGSYFQEGYEALGNALEVARLPTTDTAAGAGLSQLATRLLARQAWFGFHLGRRTQAKEQLRQSREAASQFGSQQEAGFCLSYLAAVHRHLLEFEQATEALQESLHIAHTEGDSYGASVALNILGQVAFLQGDYEAAKDYCQASIRYKREVGDQWGLTHALDYLARIAEVNKKYREAEKLYGESLSICETMGDRRGAGFCKMGFGYIALSEGNFEKARIRFEEALHIFKSIGYASYNIDCLVKLSQIESALKDFRAALTYVSMALDIAERIQALERVPTVLLETASVLHRIKKPELALTALLIAQRIMADAAESSIRYPPEMNRSIARLLMKIRQSIPTRLYTRIRAASKTTSLASLANEVGNQHKEPQNALKA